MATTQESLESISNNVANIAKETSKLLEKNYVTEESLITSSRLYQKKFGVIGDSVVHYDGDDGSPHWFEIVANKYSMEYYDYGIGGETIAKRFSGNSMVERYMNMTDDLDYIGFDGCGNDADVNVEIGEYTDFSDTTLCGALNIICKGLIEKYTGKRIFGITSPVRSASRFEYAKVFIDMCNRWAIPVFFLGERQYYDMVRNFRLKFCTSENNVHLNGDGHRYMAERLEPFMLQL